MSLRLTEMYTRFEEAGSKVARRSQMSMYRLYLIFGIYKIGLNIYPSCKEGI